MILISDTSVLIDMDIGDLIYPIFELPYTFATPDILFEQELSERHSNLVNNGLVIKELNSTQIIEVHDLFSSQRNLSFNDLLAFVLAKNESCPLLTGDGRLRKFAKTQNVEVFGSIWLVRQLIDHKLISTEEARLSFEKMRKAGSRLPWDKAENMLQQQNWGRGIVDHIRGKATVDIVTDDIMKLTRED